MYIVFMYVTPYSSQIVTELSLSTDFCGNAQISYFMQNPSSRFRVVPCGRTDMTKIIFAFRNFGNAPKKITSYAIVNFANSLQTQIDRYY